MLTARVLKTAIGAALLLAMAATTAAGFSRKPPEPEYAPGLVILKFHEEVPAHEAAAIIEGEGCTIKRFLASTGIHIVLLPEGMDVPTAVEVFGSYPEIRFAEPSYRARVPEEK